VDAAPGPLKMWFPTKKSFWHPGSRTSTASWEGSPPIWSIPERPRRGYSSPRFAASVPLCAKYTMQNASLGKGCQPRNFYGTIPSLSRTFPKLGRFPET
jgi:hypothetical protein